jgi:hypothetical protein
MSGSTSSHSESVRSLGYRNLPRSYRPRFFTVHMGNPLRIRKPPLTAARHGHIEALLITQHRECRAMHGVCHVALPVKIKRHRSNQRLITTPAKVGVFYLVAFGEKPIGIYNCYVVTLAKRSGADVSLVGANSADPPGKAPIRATSSSMPRIREGWSRFEYNDGEAAIHCHELLSIERKHAPL